jgi:hypothetical protein
MSHSFMPLRFYEGEAGCDPAKHYGAGATRQGTTEPGTPPVACAKRVVALPVEGATGCDRSVDDRCPLSLLAGVPMIAKGGRE